MAQAAANLSIPTKALGGLHTVTLTDFVLEFS